MGVKFRVSSFEFQLRQGQSVSNQGCVALERNKGSFGFAQYSCASLRMTLVLVDRVIPRLRELLELVAQFSEVLQFQQFSLR